MRRNISGTTFIASNASRSQMDSTHKNNSNESSVYESCLDENKSQNKQQTNMSSEILQTPKNSGVIKKTTSFADREMCGDEDEQTEQQRSKLADDTDVWFTPPTTLPKTNVNNQPLSK